MASHGYTEEQWRALEAALLDVGSELARPCSPIDELLSLLRRAEFLLSHMLQKCSCHEVVRSMEVAIRPATRALISNMLFRHADLSIQVAVASCINEIVRITISDCPYTEGQLKGIFQLFMVAFKQLSCESGQNFERAQRILKTVADIRSCLILLDIESGTIIVEMFLLFLETIRTSHSSDVLNHMNKIMVSIIEEIEEISMDLLSPLISSLKMDNKTTSPRSWELANSVMENCATRLRHHVREAVKAMNLDVADYAEIVASLCQDTPTGNDTVVESPISKPAKTKKSKGFSKGKKAAKSGTEKEKKHASGDVAHKMGESPTPEASKAIQCKTTDKGSSEQNSTSKSVVVQPDTISADKKRASHIGADFATKDENGNIPREHESHDVLEKELSDFRLEYGRELVNLRIKVWWPLDQTYYTGTVESYDHVTKKHKIKYDDDEEEFLDMSKERWEMFNDLQPRQVHSASKREADPSPAKEADKAQKKTAASKKEHTGTSSIRSKIHGFTAAKSAYSEAESVRVKDESDDETPEEDYSWKARAMSRVGQNGSKPSRRKGKPSRGALNGARTA